AGILLAHDPRQDGPLDEKERQRRETDALDRLPAQVASRWLARYGYERGDLVRVFDLTVAPPVLRSLMKSEVRFETGSAWSHASAIRTYTDADLEKVAAYLQWLAQ
ncbi:MAG: hypothetical protein JNL98_43560, partial [Bryobacterales bacterium]|nr:hypothetical protein [Bryobacterales bacterium]